MQLRKEGLAGDALAQRLRVAVEKQHVQADQRLQAHHRVRCTHQNKNKKNESINT